MDQQRQLTELSARMNAPAGAVEIPNPDNDAIVDMDRKAVAAHLFIRNTTPDSGNPKHEEECAALRGCHEGMVATMAWCRTHARVAGPAITLPDVPREFDYNSPFGQICQQVQAEHPKASTDWKGAEAYRRYVLAALGEGRAS